MKRVLTILTCAFSIGACAPHFGPLEAQPLSNEGEMGPPGRKSRPLIKPKTSAEIHADLAEMHAEMADCLEAKKSQEICRSLMLQNRRKLWPEGGQRKCPLSSMD